MCPTTGPHVISFPLVHFSSSSSDPLPTTERASYSTLTPPSSPPVELSPPSSSAPSFPASPLLPTLPLPHCASPLSPCSSHRRPPRRSSMPSSLTAAPTPQKKLPPPSPPPTAISNLVTAGFDGNEVVLPDPARQCLDSTGSKLWLLDPVKTRPPVMSP